MNTLYLTLNSLQLIFQSSFLSTVAIISSISQIHIHTGRSRKIKFHTNLQGGVFQMQCLHEKDILIAKYRLSSGNFYPKLQSLPELISKYTGSSRKIHVFFRIYRAFQNFFFPNMQCFPGKIFSSQYRVCLPEPFLQIYSVFQIKKNDHSIQVVFQNFFQI